MSAHTKGEWVLIRDSMRDGSAIATVEGVNTEGEVMHWTVGYANTRRDEWPANARLMAAAPSLLDALIDLAGVCDSGDGEAYVNALAAIAKATGAAK